MNLRPRLMLALFVLSGCTCSERKVEPNVTPAEVQQLLANKPPGCGAFQIIDAPDGTRQLKCIQVTPPAAEAADAGN